MELYEGINFYQTNRSLKRDLPLFISLQRSDNMHLYDRTHLCLFDAHTVPKILGLVANERLAEARRVVDWWKYSVVRFDFLVGLRRHLSFSYKLDFTNFKRTARAGSENGR